MKNIKYFITSDLHGTHPLSFINDLEYLGWDKDNINHKVLVLGDLVDGEHDKELLDKLMKLQNDRFIILKGNHDIQYNGNGKHRKWIKSLPITYKDKYIQAAHGFYDEDIEHYSKNKMIVKADRFQYKDMYEFMTVWASPILIAKPTEFWFKPNKESIMSKYKTFDDYINSLDRLTFVGHFHEDAMEKRFYDIGMVCENGFWRKGNLINVAGGHGTNKIFVLDFYENE